jgi:hypothetical protein
MCVRTACAMRICSTKSRATRRDDPLKAARTHASTPRALIWYRWRRSARGGLGCPHLARFHQDQGQAACGVSQQSAPPARFSLPCLAFTLADRPPVPPARSLSRPCPSYELEKSAGEFGRPAQRLDRSIALGRTHAAAFRPPGRSPFDQAAPTGRINREDNDSSVHNCTLTSGSLVRRVGRLASLA